MHKYFISRLSRHIIFPVLSIIVCLAFYFFDMQIVYSCLSAYYVILTLRVFDMTQVDMAVCSLLMQTKSDVAVWFLFDMMIFDVFSAVVLAPMAIFFSFKIIVLAILTLSLCYKKIKLVSFLCVDLSHLGWILCISFIISPVLALVYLSYGQFWLTIFISGYVLILYALTPWVIKYLFVHYQTDC